MTMNWLSLVGDIGPIMTAVEAIEDNSDTVLAKGQGVVSAFEALEKEAVAAGLTTFSGVKDAFEEFIQAIVADFSAVKNVVTTVGQNVGAATAVSAEPGQPVTAGQAVTATS